MTVTISKTRANGRPKSRSQSFGQAADHVIDNRRANVICREVQGLHGCYSYLRFFRSKSRAGIFHFGEASALRITQAAKVGYQVGQPLERNYFVSIIAHGVIHPERAAGHNATRFTCHFARPRGR